MTNPPRLHPDTIAAHLETECLGRQLIVFQETGSTNDRVRQAAEGGAGEGLTIFAESQTAGRGQHGRQWLSPPGVGLWFSVLLRSTLPRADYPKLVQAAALATAEALDACSMHPPPLIKWPNDLYVGAAKLAGFLLEASSDTTWQVLGFGLNVHAPPPGFPEGQATCVDNHAREPPAVRAKLAAAILNRFEHRYRRWDPEELEASLRARQWRG